MSRRFENSKQKEKDVGSKEFNKRYFRFNGIPLHHELPPFGPPSHPFMLPPPPFGPHPPQGPPLPFDRDSFKEIRQLILLIFLSDNPEGITGYQLQENYHFPRGTLLRDLDEFEEMEHVEIREDVIKGRAQKFYTITEKGKLFIEELKRKWANRLALMSEMAPPEIYGIPFFREQFRTPYSEMLENFKTKEEVLGFFRGIRAWLTAFLTRLNRRQDIFENLKSDISNVILNIEKMNTLKSDEIKDEIDRIHKSFYKNHKDLDY